MLCRGTTPLKVTSGRLKPPGIVSFGLVEERTPFNSHPVFTCWRTSKMGYTITQNAVWFLEKFGLVPKGTYSVGQSLIVAAKALVAGGKTKLFT